MGLSKVIIGSVFDKCGIKLNGSDADLVVNDDSFFRDVLLRGSIGFGDSYIEGKWDSDKIDVVVSRVLSRGIYQRFASVYNLARIVSSKVVNLQSRGRAKKVIEEHYDLPTEFYSAFLDPYMQYTCGLFKDTDDLAVAQENKMRLICEKLELKKGQRVLDIGGGWGGLARFMRERYEVNPTVVTLSQEQGDHIKKTASGIEVLIADYRDIPRLDFGLFDAVSVVGFIEHVGHKNYQTAMRIISDSLKNEGKFLTFL